MKHAGSIALRSASLGDETSVQPVNRKGFFKGIMMALHLSRRRQARHLVRRYRRLIAEDFRCQLANALIELNSEKESSRNASGDQTSVRGACRSNYDV